MTNTIQNTSTVKNATQDHPSSH